jgi:hypothetical protein|tara:strand:+ start:601 stop:1032 length:432 start_codon:yes stop_codon:yes gene_type:complete
MHIGFYLPTLGSSEFNIKLFNKLNEIVDSQEYDDVCVFYDDLNYNPINPKFGVFNSSELWSFTGVLFISSFDMIPQVKSTINKFKSVVLYDGTKNLLDILSGIQEFEVVTQNEEDYGYIKRVTGKETHLMKDFNFTEFLGLAK